MTVQVFGGEQFRGQFARLKGAAPGVMNEFVTRITLAVHKEAVRGIQRGPASGRLYPSRVNPNVMHRASAPGEYPMSDSGRLAGSVKFELPTSKTRPEGFVGTNLAYGAMLELKPSARGGRPWLGRAVKVVMRRGADDILDKIFKKRMKP